MNDAKILIDEFFRILLQNKSKKEIIFPGYLYFEKEQAGPNDQKNWNKILNLLEKNKDKKPGDLISVCIEELRP